MNYRSYQDLSDHIKYNVNNLPHDIDLIVGVPRSGLLAANIMALHMNLPLCDYSSLIENRELGSGKTRRTKKPGLKFPQDSQHVLIVDDSVGSGATMLEIKDQIKNQKFSSKVSYCSIYVTRNSRKFVDYYFDTVQAPRAFEWNIMHRDFLIECCVDIDGVLCLDPIDEENDDGERYKRFLLEAKPVAMPSYPIGYLVTSRLEKYREHTENWLKNNNIEYKKLFMLNLPSAEERRKRGCHAQFKAKIYSELDDARLFIESEAHQANEIAQKSGKPVLCYEDQVIYKSGMSVRRVNEEMKVGYQLFALKMKLRFKRIVGRFVRT